jgi:tetratricopeptide (TPR) repeat protein
MISTRELRVGLFALAAALGMAVLAASGFAAPQSTIVAGAHQVPMRPGNAALMVEIGRRHYRAGDHHKALAAAVKALELDPAAPQALQFRGQLLRDARGPVAALPWFERALELRPADLELLGDYAATLAEAGRHRDMLATARRMVKLDPADPRPYFLQAILAARSGHDDLARRLLARTGNVYAEVPAGRLLAAVLELRAGNAVLAADALETLAQQQADNAEATLLLGRALLAANDAREAVARLSPLADRADASPYLLTMVGRAYEQLGNRAKAARYLDRAAARPRAMLSVLAAPVDGAITGTSGRSQDAGAVVQQVRRLLGLGRTGEALVLAAKASRRYPGSADVQRLAGDTALLAGDPRGALTRYAQAAQIRRDFPLVYRMVTALRMAGYERDALMLLIDHVAHNPREPDGPKLLGRLLAQQGYSADGAMLLTLAGRLGGHADPALLADRATVDLALGEANGALSLALRAYALQRSNQRAAGVLARALAATGARDRQAHAVAPKVPIASGRPAQPSSI